jgi:parvulin-like peptidyl-prolyl isomerase
VEKMLGKDIKISDKEVEDFVKGNPTAKDLSKDQLKEQIRSQKVSEKFQTWIEDLKKKAKISKFI